MPKRLPVLLALAWSVNVFGQNAGRTVDPAERATAARIAALSARLDPDTRRGLDPDEWDAERRRNTDAIRQEVTTFVEASIEPSHLGEGVQARLQALLAAQPAGLEFTDPPRARVADLRFGRALVLCYAIVRPPHFDSGILAGFREDGGRYRLAATAGAELDGYTLFTMEVGSPNRQEMWLLAGGRARTFNGARFRFRLYAFDGKHFRTIWSPADVFDATVRMTPEGFAITHVPHRAPASVTDHYVVTVDGVSRLQADRPAPVFRVTAELVQFDARFLDQQGRPVTDIRKDEVTVNQQGREVPLADLRFEPRVARPVDDTPSEQPVSSAPPAAPDQRAPAIEPWIFLIDDLAMAPDAFARCRSALLELLGRGIPPGVEVGILRTGELGRRTTQVSSDRVALIRAVTAMRYANHRWRGGRASRSGATGAGTAGKDRIFLEGTLGSLNSLLVNLRQLDGRKVVVVLSEFIALTGRDLDHEPGGIGIAPGDEQYANVAGRLRRLGRLAAESGVTVHTVDLAGVNNLGSRERVMFDEGSHAIADELGGVYFGNSNDAGALLARLVAAEAGQYVLSYVPPDGTFDSRGKPRFVPITVTVSRPGVTVRTRSGFFTH